MNKLTVTDLYLIKSSKLGTNKSICVRYNIIRKQLYCIHHATIPIEDLLTLLPSITVDTPFAEINSIMKIR